MQLSEIREEVQLIMQDNDVFISDIVDGYINEIYFSTVSECLVPELKGVDVVTATVSQAYVQLSGVSGGFSGVLSRVYNSSNESVEIVNSLETLMDLYGSLADTGDIVAVALEGSTLWYCQLPAVSEVLTVIYYKNPVLLVNDEDTPLYIPDFLHRRILVNGAAAVCFDLVEDEKDTTKVNTRSRENAKLEGVVKFKEWLGKTRKHYIYSQEEY